MVFLCNKISNPDERSELSSMLSIEEVTKLLPVSKSRVTIRNWMREGRTSRSGMIIRLRHRRIGSELFTTEQWLLQFFDDLTESDLEYFDTNRENICLAKSSSNKSKRQVRVSKTKAYLKTQGLDPIAKEEEE